MRGACQASKAVHVRRIGGFLWSHALNWWIIGPPNGQLVDHLNATPERQIADARQAGTGDAVTRSGGEDAMRGPDTIGWHLAASLDAARDAESKRDFMGLDRYTREVALLEGAAAGHAFRAAELAYDMGVAHGRTGAGRAELADEIRYLLAFAYPHPVERPTPDDAAGRVHTRTLDRAAEHWDKETVYDEQIAPIMGQIIAICKEHRIPLVARFQYADSEDDGPAFVTTVLVAGGVACREMVDLAQMVRPRRPVAQ